MLASGEVCKCVQHAPRDTQEQPAALPVHTPIATEAYKPGERVTNIKTFQFLDDNEFAKVYLPLENLEQISKENVTAQFETNAFMIIIRGLQDTPLQFSVSKLHKNIVPEECTFKIMKSKILIKLKKACEEPEKEEMVEGAHNDEHVDAEVAEDQVDSAAEQEVEKQAPRQTEKKYPHWYNLKG
jgi:hypothetical protein